MPAQPPRLLKKHKLLPWLQEVSEWGLASGALQSSETDIAVIKDGLPFEVRVLSNLRKKTRRMRNDSAIPNPFLPYDRDLYVSHLNSGHVVLLNKFNVVSNHLLIVTPEFEAQESLLALKEFIALTEVMNEFPMLVFYNSGQEAGASQPHKHLQAIPLPELSIAGALADISNKPAGLESLPFRHRVSTLEMCKHPLAQAESWHSLYLKMLEELSIYTPGNPPKPYNLLMTSEWMMVVPRTCGRYQGVSVNALGFAGLLLVKDQKRLEELESLGPAKLLRSVTQAENKVED